MLTNDGAISANGNNGDRRAGGGAGGGIFINCGTLAGSGSISANGGNGGSYSNYKTGGGGGGRVAVLYITKTYTGSVTAYGGGGVNGGGNGGAGTIYWKEASQTNGEVIVDNNTYTDGKTEFLSTMSAGTFPITISNATLVLNEEQTISSLTVNSNATLILNGKQTISSLTMEGSTTLVLNGEPTFSNLVINDGVTVTHSETTTTTTYSMNLTVTEDLTINSGGKIDVSGKGYLGGNSGGNSGNYGRTSGNVTTNGSSSFCGGSYAGLGGSGWTGNVGAVYGDITDPTEPGAGGGGNNGNYGGAAGGDGGGLIRLTVNGTLTNDGTISANGNNGSQRGGGAGGGVYINCGTLAGSGSISANGGNGGSYSSYKTGGGGGGRIAIYYTASEYNGLISTYGGYGVNGGGDGEEGTSYWTDSCYGCPDIFIISPNKGGDIGEVSVALMGNGFKDGATVRLERSDETEISGDPVTVNDDGTEITAIFDLSGKTRGKWDVVVENPDGLNITRSEGFTIEEGVYSSFWANIQGRTRVMGGRQQTYSISYGSDRDGNTDVPGAIVWVSIPSNTSVDTDLPYFEDDDGNKMLEVPVSNIKPGEEGKIPFKIIPPLLAHYNLVIKGSWVTGAISEAFKKPWVKVQPEAIENTDSFSDVSLRVYDNDSNSIGDIQVQITSDDATEEAAPTVKVTESGDQIEYKYSATVRDSQENIKDVVMLVRGARSVCNTIWNSSEKYSNVSTVVGAALQTYAVYDQGKDMNCAVQLQKENLELIQWLWDKNIMSAEDAEKLMEDVNSDTTFVITASIVDVLSKFLSVPLVGGYVSPFIKALKGLINSRVPFWVANDVKTDPSKYMDILGIEPENMEGFGFYSKLQQMRLEEGMGGSSQSDSTKLTIFTLISGDPNDKNGPQGGEDVHYITSEEPFKYTIFFENVGSATANAIEVVIDDQIDTEKFDINSFKLGSISFGTYTTTAASGLKEYAKNIDLRPGRNLIVRIEAGIQDDGVAKWHFFSIDPETNEITEDPFGGFLPPNKKSPEGEGSVSFTISPKDSLQTGDEVRNKATITFDANAPMDTPEWLNTIENVKPASQVLPLESTQGSNKFDVQWEGSDEHAGIKNYTIYVSENGGSYKSWLSNTSNTSAIYTGKWGKNYSFYSVAKDNAENTEAAPGAPDVTTQVVTTTTTTTTTTTSSTTTSSTTTTSTSTTTTSSTTTTTLPVPTPVVTPSPEPSPTEPPTAVELLYFRAKANDDGSVTLKWKTATEVDNAGFNIYRSTSRGGSYTQINSTLIPAKGNSTSGANYSHEDTPGSGTFYYKLEDVDNNGVSNMHGPVRVKN